ncbi:hypothetical protein ACHAWF_001704 [Thalassiosira exigua]
MERKECVRIKYDGIPLEFCDEYKLDSYVRGSWVYFEVVRGAYGLPQSGKLANDLLCKRLEATGYFVAPTTPGLWRHTWRPVEYVGKQHTNHLLSVFKQHYEMLEDWDNSKFAGIDLEWTYGQCHQDHLSRLSMQDYIGDLLFCQGH